MDRKSRLRQGFIVSTVLLACLSLPAEGSDLAAMLNRQEQWLATSPEGPGWNQYLLSDMLREEMSKHPSEVDHGNIAKVLSRYASGVAGLEHPYFAATRAALSDWANQTNVPLATRWAEQLRAKAATAAPIDQANISNARDELDAATRALDQMLQRADSATEQGWKRFLKWNDLETQLNTSTPNWKALESVGVQFFNGHRGLEYPEFVRVRNSLRKYLFLGSIGSNGKSQETVAAQLNALADAMETYGQTPSTRNAAEVAAQLDWLVQLGQVPTLASTIRGAHSMPNLKIRVSENLLTRRFAQDVTEPTPVSENILGTHVTGTAVTSGKVTTDVVTNHDSARIDIIFRGVTETQSIGRQKPVTVRSTSITALEARKPLYVYRDRITSGPAKAYGNTSTTIHSITPDRHLGRRLIERVAWKRAAEQKSQAESIASARTARRLEGQIESKTQELLTRAQQTLREQLTGPVNRRGLIPEAISTMSTDECAIVHATQASRAQFAANTSPPEFCPDAGVVAQLHESAFNNTAQKAIAGLTLTDERVAELVEEATGSVPEELQISDDKDPWSISFDWYQPVTVEFRGGQLTIAIRGRRFTSGDKAVTNMEISAKYALQTTPEGVRLTRIGDVDVTFPKKSRIGTTDRVLKTLMEKKFAEVFKPEIQGEGFTLPGRFESLGPIRLNEISADSGWLSLGWR